MTLRYSIFHILQSESRLSDILSVSHQIAFRALDSNQHFYRRFCDKFERFIFMDLRFESILRGRLLFRVIMFCC